MNKKLIAIAVAAGMAAPMAANAAPTVYGQLQAEIASEGSDIAGADVDTDSPFDGNVIQNNSRWAQDGVGVQDEQRGRLGVKGSEDLGGGLTALYKFEWQVDTTTGSLTDGERNTLVGLKGNFGTVKIGNLKSAYKYYGGGSYDPFITTSAEARRFGGMTAGTFGHNGFMSNSVSYQNNFGGGELWITYSPDEQTGQDGDYAAGFKMNGGNWEAFVAAAHQDDTDATSTTNNPAYDALKVGGQWSTGPHKISAQYEMTNQEVTGGDDEGTLLYANYQMSMGKNTFSASYGTGEVDFAGSTTDQENTFYSVGVVHKLSKKTRVIVAYSDAEVENAGAVPSATPALAAGSTINKDAFVAAMRVDF